MYGLSDLVTMVKVLERGLEGAELNAPAQFCFESVFFKLHYDTLVAALSAWVGNELRGGD